MSRLTWGALGERYFETGVDRGVLYVGEDPGVAWNGLISVSESPTGGEAKPAYVDGYKFRNLASSEEFEATIDAFTAPKEFGPCDGTSAIQNGLFITQQPRKRFNFTYRTMVGNGAQGPDADYKIHLVYGCQAAPSEKGYTTVNDSPEAMALSWEFTTTPVAVTGHKDTALLVIDSTKEAAEAFFSGRCQAYTADAGTLAAMRLRAPSDAGSFVILPERISREPLSPVVWGGDPEWTTVIRWVLNTLILAEEYGVTRDGLDAAIAENRNPLLRLNYDERDMLSRSMGIESGWGIRVLRAVGNYGEIYERNVGRDSPLKIKRGLNRLWNQGGLHYAPPLD